ncbi:hypothetical protein [Saccharopolyspora mangrovi]|uniref:Uncharacterized protein n=1 Tax=Saccharopolyspora mangrovi TaxID=3082379 RepID=A0ABU6ABF6_9PSEU|nr:hypothetical protein [Saccharopolyspora sp. S2-29]MEB3368892.1 hypothetical protein [Saccharopolyspora sp. S2-29]
MITTWTVLLITAAVLFSLALDLALWAQRLPSRTPPPSCAETPRYDADCGFPP